MINYFMFIIILEYCGNTMAIICENNVKFKVRLGKKYFKYCNK
ncbi:hypothetical protein [Clostridium sp. SHJSY1]|nr:hypothetical protein [Clostridium sp. SHJSY1]